MYMLISIFSGRRNLGEYSLKSATWIRNISVAYTVLSIVIIMFVVPKGDTFDLTGVLWSLILWITMASGVVDTIFCLFVIKVRRSIYRDELSDHKILQKK